MAFVDNERRYQYVNERYEQFFDVKLDELKGKLVAEVLVSDLTSVSRRSTHVFWPVRMYPCEKK